MIYLLLFYSFKITMQKYYTRANNYNIKIKYFYLYFDLYFNKKKLFSLFTF